MSHIPVSFFLHGSPFNHQGFLEENWFSSFLAVLAFSRRILSLLLVAQVLQPILQHDAHPKDTKAVSFEKMDV